VEEIVQESTRASSVVSRVRALFRKDTQAREPADMNRLIRDLVRVLRDEAIRREIAIRLDLAEDLPRLTIDQIQIQQVIRNLVINAMESMVNSAPPREINIRSAKHDHGRILITVEDRGPGVAAEIAPRIFEPFFTTKPEGTGMGLAICRSIVEAHDGRLWAENSALGGAIFQFSVRAQQ
jgi:signal transduction histidine kinase